MVIAVSCWSGMRRQAQCQGWAAIQHQPTFAECEDVLRLMHDSLDMVGTTASLIGSLNRLEGFYHLGLKLANVEQKNDTGITWRTSVTKRGANANERRPQRTRNSSKAPVLWARLAETQRIDRWMYDCVVQPTDGSNTNSTLALRQLLA